MQNSARSARTAVRDVTTMYTLNESGIPRAWLNIVPSFAQPTPTDFDYRVEAITAALAGLPKV